MTLIVLLLKKGDGDRPRLFSMQLRPSCGKWVRERSIPNPICGVVAGWAYPTQRAWGVALRKRTASEQRLASAISDNRDGEKLNHERRDSNSKQSLARKNQESRAAIPGQTLSLRPRASKPTDTPIFCFRRGKTFVFLKTNGEYDAGRPAHIQHSAAGNTAYRRDS